MNNKFRYSRNQRIFNIYYKKIRKRIWKITKPTLLFLLKALGWLILLGIILIITSYDDYGENPSIGLVFSIYLMIIIIHYAALQNYKNWVLSAKYDEFNKRFCEQYKPHIIGYLFMYSIGLKYCNSIGFICCSLLPYLIDLWDRRFITNDIKQNMILENLKNINRG